MARPALHHGDAFGIAREVARAWPDVEAGTKYDGSPVLTCRGCFMAGLALHPSAEPGTLVARIEPAARPSLLDEAAETYYVTDYYEPHPVVLARLARLDRAALRDLLAMARRATLLKAPRARRASR
jgi:hypothetical protein